MESSKVRLERELDRTDETGLAEATDAALQLQRQELGRVIVALGEAESLEELMSIIASPEYERWEGEPEVEMAEGAARDRLLEGVDVYSVPLDDAKLWRERFEGLQTACKDLVDAAGKDSVAFFRALARVRVLVD